MNDIISSVELNSHMLVMSFLANTLQVMQKNVATIYPTL